MADTASEQAVALLRVFPLIIVFAALESEPIPTEVVSITVFPTTAVDTVPSH